MILQMNSLIRGKRKVLNWDVFSSGIDSTTWNKVFNNQELRIDLRGLDFIAHEGLIWLLFISYQRKIYGFRTELIPPDDDLQVGYIKYSEFRNLERLCNFSFCYSYIFENESSDVFRAKDEYKRKFKSIKYINGSNWVDIIRIYKPDLISYLSRELKIPPGTDYEDNYLRPFVIVLQELIQNIGTYGGINEGNGFGFASIAAHPKKFPVVRYCFSDIGPGFRYSLNKKNDKRYFCKDKDKIKGSIFTGLLFRFFYPKEGVIGLYPALSIIAKYKGKLIIRNDDRQCLIDLSNKSKRSNFIRNYKNPSYSWLDEIVVTTNCPLIRGTHIQIDLQLEGPR